MSKPYEYSVWLWLTVSEVLAGLTHHPERDAEHCEEILGRCLGPSKQRELYDELEGKSQTHYGKESR